MADYKKIVTTYENALGSVTQSTYSWTAFLRSACRNYKFGFDEQLLIYAQRPDATAVLMFDKWNKDFGRRIRSGAKGIAVFDTQAGRGRLKHYFDISDTYATSNAREVPIWKITPQNARAVVERLQRVYELDANNGADGKAPAADLAQTLIAAAKSAVEDSFERHFDDMAQITLTGNLSDLDEDSLQAVYKGVLENSVAYMLLTRCGLDASRFIDVREFRNLSSFSSRHAVNTLGGAVSELGEDCLREIAAAAQNREKSEKKKTDKNSNRTFDNAAKKNYIDIGKKSETERGLENDETATRQTARPFEDNRGSQSVDNVSSSGGRDVTGLLAGGRERGTDRGASGGTSGAGLREIRDNAPPLLGEAQAGALLDSQNDADASQALGRGSDRSYGQNGLASQANGESRGRDGGTESPRPDGVGRQDEQYSGESRGNNVAGSGLRLNPPPPQDEQLDIWEKAGSKLPALSISQQIIDEVLTSGGNIEHSPHRIVSIMKKDDDPMTAGVILSEEYGEGGKGFIIGGQRVSVWFNADGIRVAVGDNAKNNPSATLVDWEQAAIRTRALLDLGRFMPQAELDKVDGYELAEVAERIIYLNRELNEDAKLDFLGADTIRGNFPDDTARIAEMLASRDGLDKIVKGFDDWIVKYFEDESIVRFKTKENDPVEVMGAVYRLIDEPLHFESNPDFEQRTSQFITQDEIDEVLIGRGSGIESGKYRIYGYFLQDHSTNEKAAFLSKEYGWGGYGRTGFNETHVASGLHISRGDIFEPYDKVSLSWTKVAERIDTLIADGRYMSQQELDAIPGYEKRELAGEIYHFFDSRPDDADILRPYPQDVDYMGAIKTIRKGLDDRAQVERILKQMGDILDNTADFDPHFRDMRKAQDDLTAFSNGNYSLFTPAERTGEPLTPTAEKHQRARTSGGEQKQARAAKREQPLTPTAREVNENTEYSLQLGTTIYIGTDEYEINGLGADKVILRDVNVPLFTVDMERGEFDRKLRENPLNDGLIKTSEEETAQTTAETDRTAQIVQSLMEQVRDELLERGFSVSDELVELGISEFSGSGTFQDIADGIEDAYLSEDADEVEDSEQEQAEQADQEEYIPKIGDRYEIQGRMFAVESVNLEFYNVELRDITFQNGVGFPIFRKEPLEFIRMYDPVRAEKSASRAENSKDRPVIKEETPKNDPTEQSELPEQAEQAAEPPITPAWEKAAAERRRERAQTFDTHPEIPMSQRRNYQITDDNLGAGGAKVKYKNNVKAIKTLKQIEAENRFATADEQEILSKYVGWGGVPQAFDADNKNWTDEYTELKGLLTQTEYESARASTLNAHYTSPTVIKAIYKAVEQMGFKNGNILEPSCGIGNFMGLLPESMSESKMYGVELDSLTGRIAQQLYQKNSIAIQGFEKTNFPDSFFDLAIGNVPFGSYAVSDKKYDKLKFHIHDYFFAKTLDKVRPGGVVAFVTSKYTLDKVDSKVRQYLAQRADFLGAIRLPCNAFKSNANTEVTTDIIFLQKRDKVTDLDPSWLRLGEIDGKDAEGNDAQIRVNAYFAEHPEMILGEMAFDDRFFGNERDTACLPIDGADLSQQLDEAVQNIAADNDANARFTDYERNGDIEDGDEPKADDSIPADPTVRNFSYTLVNGKIYFRQDSRMFPQDIPKATQNRIKGLIGLRDSVRKLIEYQTEDYLENDIQHEQARLNRLYDDFTKKYGLINSRGNSGAFSGDSSYPILSSLEVINEDGELERKADIFSKRTIRPRTVVDHVDTASEALAVSLNERAHVDLEYMSELTGISEQDIIKELEGVIFQDITDINAADEPPLYVTADEYLSGNVREKLATARQFEEAFPGAYAVNVKALEAVQPEDLTAAEIEVRLGSTWVPQEVVERFVHETLNTPSYLRHKIKVEFVKKTGEWNISEKSSDKGNVRANSIFGTKRMSAYKIIEETLNLRDVQINDTVVDENNKERRVLNKRETALAQAKQDELKEKFVQWIWQDYTRREKLCALYNEKFNSTRPREYDGSHLTFPGMNPEITLRPHQTNAIAHILYGGNTLLAHEVGAGKTYEMVAAAMESKRLGLCSKTLIVVPNHITEQWSGEFLQLYPSANILVATRKDFERNNRRKFFGRIATGDYDAVIIGHSQFEKIPLSAERQTKMMEAQIDELVEGITEARSDRGEKSYTVKQLEKMKKTLETKLEALNDQSRKDTGVVTFEELGIDRLYIDESHYFKNLMTISKMRNVGGISNSHAQKSSDLFMKCRYLDEITGGRGSVHASGTPISNSMVEMFTIMRYLQYAELEKRDLTNFDAWASTFGETVTAVVIRG